MSNLTFAGPGYTYYETIPGGAGASALGPGADAVQTHMTNTRNTPVEAFERLYPVRFEHLSLRAGSGGRGRQRGGAGVEKRLRFLAPAEASFTGDRQALGPYGLAGGRRGARGRLRLKGGGRWETLPGHWSGKLQVGAVLQVETPGGGGYGTARHS
jgi:N-methylhydantoinase B/oxoprolinase/acetone carboxylase alpha subunit